MPIAYLIVGIVFLVGLVNLMAKSFEWIIREVERNLVPSAESQTRQPDSESKV